MKYHDLHILFNASSVPIAESLGYVVIKKSQFGLWLIGKKWV